MEQNITIRKWLKENDYQDVAEQIDIIMNIWQEKGAKTRRNWWEVLAGGKNGKPRTIEGITLPVLKAAQLRQGLPITSNAICRKEDENIPVIRTNGRWPQSRNSGAA